MTPLEEVAALDAGLAKLLASNEYVGLGEPDELAGGQFQMAVRYKNDAFRIIRADKSLVGVFASWNAALGAMALLKPAAAGTGLSHSQA